ncbi:MAG TPA: DUF2336 domain-containing protein [Xanthobacteraceae bacterium]|nr:DUF2336 domain-containing protein [Xanthobacteraceae bacterium]
MRAEAQPLILELDSALSRATAAWRNSTMRRLMDLFLVDAASYTDDQVQVFDDIICRLIEKVDRRTLIELASRLAEINNAPVNVVRTLARHADVQVAGPLLEKSSVLTDADLAEIADKDRRDPAVLSMIAGRPQQLGAAVTDVLIRRGNTALARRILDRPDAVISEAGFARMVTSVGTDKEFASAIAKREDLPAELRPWLDVALAG